MKVRLNKRTLDDAVYQGPGSCYLWDTELAAFGLRIYPTGRKSFVVSYWSRGRRRFHVLGQYGRLTLPQAREAALEVFLRVRRGEDPAGDKQALAEAEASWDGYRYRDPGGRSFDDGEAVWRHHGDALFQLVADPR